MRLIETDEGTCIILMPQAAAFRVVATLPGAVALALLLDGNLQPDRYVLLLSYGSEWNLVNPDDDPLHDDEITAVQQALEKISGDLDNEEIDADLEPLAAFVDRAEAQDAYESGEE